MISGYICVRNGDDLDYCWREAVQSLLPICEEVLICDSDSTDGTTGLACEWASREPKIRIINWKWPSPVRDLWWWTDWINYARGFLRYPVQLQLDADEVLDPGSYEQIRALAQAGERVWFERINYWRDPDHVAPEGTVCSHLVARLGPTQDYMTSDGPAKMQPNIRTYAIKPNPLPLIHHYGFLRRNDAFMRKSLAVQTAFFGDVDKRIEENQRVLGDWKQGDYFGGRPLLSRIAPHPSFMRKWLRERGYEIGS